MWDNVNALALPRDDFQSLWGKLRRQLADMPQQQLHAVDATLAELSRSNAAAGVNALCQAATRLNAGSPVSGRKQ